MKLATTKPCFVICVLIKLIKFLLVDGIGDKRTYNSMKFLSSVGYNLQIAVGALIVAYQKHAASTFCVLY